MKKRVLVVAQHYWPEDFRINDIVKGFTEQGLCVDVLCGIPNYPKGRFYDGYGVFKQRRQQKDGVGIYRAYEIPRGNSSAGIFLNYISYPFYALFTLLTLWRKKYDCVFSYETSPVLMIFPAIVAAKTRRIPLCTYVLDLWPENLYSVLPVQNKLLRRIALSVSAFHYRHGGKLIAMSKPQRDRLSDITGKRREDIAVLPQYCEDMYAEGSKPKATHGDVFNIMFAGNFSPAQGLPILIEAAQMLKEKGIEDVHFLMYGDGMSHADFANRVAQANVDSYFTMFGRVTQQDIIAASEHADALFISLKGSDMLDMTIPAKVSSCMAMCRPLLCCLSGAGADVITEADCGFCGAPDDATALFENIIALKDMSHEELCKLSQNAKDYYEQHFSRSVLLPRIIKYLTEN